MYFLPEGLSIAAKLGLPIFRPQSSPWPGVHFNPLVFVETLHFYDAITPAFQLLAAIQSCENARDAQRPFTFEIRCLAELPVHPTLSPCKLICCPPDFLNDTSACVKQQPTQLACTSRHIALPI